MQVMTLCFHCSKLNLWPVVLSFQAMNNVLGMVTYDTMAPILIIIIYHRCFPHIVNLAVQAVLGSITNMSYANEDANHFSIWQLSTCNVIALLQMLINKVIVPSYTCKKYRYLKAQIRASSIRRLEFEEIQKMYMKDKPVLKLICDVSIRWSSTHLMLLCATQLQRICL